MRTKKCVMGALVTAAGLGTSGLAAGADPAPCVESATVTVVTRSRAPVRIIGQPANDLVAVIQPRELDRLPDKSWVASIPAAPEWALYTELCAEQGGAGRGEGEADGQGAARQDCQPVDACSLEPGTLGIKPIRFELH